MLQYEKFYINGQWVSPHSSVRLPVINPSTEEPFATIALGDQSDTDAAVAAAVQALPSWRSAPMEERIDVVERILHEYKARINDVADAISTEMGAPLDLALDDQAGCCISHVKSFVRAAREHEAGAPLGPHAPQTYIIHEPIGVCGLITPWNWPMSQVFLKVIPAMLAGCTMVLKPSEVAPISSMVLAEILHSADVPAGVFNLVNGDGVGVGTQLASHPDIDMVSFTGSTRAGIAVSKNAADTLKRVQLELGGKGANIIFADAAPDAAARGATWMFENTGQSCNAPSRMLVERSIYDQVVNQVKETAENTKVDVASEHGDHIGPLVSEVQYNRVRALIQVGIEEGARLVTGGLERPEGLSKGYFVRPTVFADVNNEMRIAKEEIFGPVLVIIPFDTEDEAIAIANDTTYGLTNYIQTEDDAKRMRVALQVRSGMVETNGVSRGAGCPFGGVKASGNGREGSKWGLLEFMEIKAISGWVDA